MPPAPFASRLLVAAFAAQAATALGAESALPRLAGIIVGPQMREAVFVERNGAERTLFVREGEQIGGVKILKIKPDEVVLSGPSGVATLQLEQSGESLAWRAAPPPAPSPDLRDLRAETLKSGSSIALLALERDSCARAGLLPNVAPDSEANLQRLIVSIAKVPAHDGAHDAPTSLLAGALGEGLEDAKQRFGSTEINGAACVEWNASWRAAAPRYGLP